MITNGFIIKLLSPQIPTFWEAIKHACKQADEVNEKDLPSYLNELLHSLLSDKAQCWARLDEERRLIALCLTRIQGDKTTGEKSLFIQGLYSWQPAPEEIWARDIGFLREFALKEDCKSIRFNSRNERIWEITQGLGFKEMTRTFSIEL